MSGRRPSRVPGATGRATRAARLLSRPHILLLLLVVAAVTVSAGCASLGLGPPTGSGTPATQKYDYTDFSGVRAGDGCELTVVRGDAYSVSVTVDDNLLGDLRVQVQGDTLRIGLQPDREYSNVTLSAKVTMPELTWLELDGASRATVEGFDSSEELDVVVSGDSRAELWGMRAGPVIVEVSGASDVTGELETQELSGRVSGAGTVELRGSARTLQLDAFGAARLLLGSFAVEEAALDLSGGSTADVHVTGTLSVAASSGSSVKYAGSPKLGAVQTSGGAELDPAE